MPISGERILVTGGQGPSGFPLVKALAPDNDVFVLARFTEPGSQEKIESVGAHCVVQDLFEPFDSMPTDFAYIYHSAFPNWFEQPGAPGTFDENADSTGRLMAH